MKNTKHSQPPSGIDTWPGSSQPACHELSRQIEGKVDLQMLVKVVLNQPLLGTDHHRHSEDRKQFLIIGKPLFSIVTNCIDYLPDNYVFISHIRLNIKLFGCGPTGLTPKP